jgi:pyruvate dehydrogenase E2 component (dihydrolipoamide acetyltransferase)
MARSKREIPHYYLSQQVDMTAALDWLERENLERPVPERLLPAVLLIKAVAHALEEMPDMNGFWTDDQFVPGEGIHPGIAISLREGGLVAPAIRHADRLDLSELMAALRDLVSRTRGGVLQRTEMTDPTITITNLGDQGVDAVYGVIYPPQVALVGFGRVVERAWSEQGMLGARRVLTATLAADHRASDGHRGGLFLAAIERWLQEPENL